MVHVPLTYIIHFGDHYLTNGYFNTRVLRRERSSNLQPPTKLLYRCHMTLTNISILRNHVQENYLQSVIAPILTYIIHFGDHYLTNGYFNTRVLRRERSSNLQPPTKLLYRCHMTLTNISILRNHVQENYLQSVIAPILTYIIHFGDHYLTNGYFNTRVLRRERSSNLQPPTKLLYRCHMTLTYISILRNHVQENYLQSVIAPILTYIIHFGDHYLDKRFLQYKSTKERLQPPTPPTKLLYRCHMTLTNISILRNHVQENYLQSVCNG